MQFPHDKRMNPTMNPVGEYVALNWKGRKLLGEIVSVGRDMLTGCITATVKHFNGELWPISPRLFALEWVKHNESA